MYDPVENDESTGKQDEAVWPPPTSIDGDAELPGESTQVFQNTSGTRGPLPPEIARMKWNWGAFALAPFWLGYHGYVVAGILIGAVALATRIGESVSVMFYGLAFIMWIGCVYLGAVGHKLAWRRRRYESVEQYIEVESIWRNWSVGWLIIVGFSMIRHIVQIASYL